jgi:hypothetical protein
MSFQYVNPTSSTQIAGPVSVSRDSDTGVIFSVNSIGGYMEVWSLADLNWVIPQDTYDNGGPVAFSGNVIPISFTSGGYVPYNPPVINQLNLNNDGISSGRRRLGMLVFVQENLTTYQYIIPNYNSLWNIAEADGSIYDVAGTGYFVLNDTAGGTALMNAWTGSTIEGVSGVTHNDARWRIASLNDTIITGGTYYSATTTLELFSNDNTTVTITGFTGTVTGGTYNSGTGTLTLNNSDGSSVNVSGFTSGGGGSPLTVYDATSGVTATNVTGMTLSGASVIDNGG